MKQGDVFVIEGIESLFIADTVTPSGAVYARKVDIYKGAHGGTEAFPANTKFQVLFNSLGLSGSLSTAKVGSTTLKDFVISRNESFQALVTKSNLKETLEDEIRPEKEKKPMDTSINIYASHLVILFGHPKPSNVNGEVQEIIPLLQKNNGLFPAPDCKIIVTVARVKSVTEYNEITSFTLALLEQEGESIANFNIKRVGYNSATKYKYFQAAWLIPTNRPEANVAGTNKSRAREAAISWWRSPQSRLFWDGINAHSGDGANCDNCGQPIPPLEGYLCVPQRLICEECFNTGEYIAYGQHGKVGGFAPSLRILIPETKKWWEFWK